MHSPYVQSTMAMDWLLTGPPACKAPQALDTLRLLPQQQQKRRVLLAGAYESYQVVGAGLHIPFMQSWVISQRRSNSYKQGSPRLDRRSH